MAFWTPYAVDDNTWALVAFDAPDPTVAVGRVVGPGVLAGDATFSPEGRFGGAVQLGGAGAIHFPLEPFQAHRDLRRGALAIEAWVKLKRYPADGVTAVVLSRAHVADVATGFALSISADGALGMHFINPSGTHAEVRSGAGAVPLDEWTHVAGVLRSGLLANQGFSVFVNGREMATGAGATVASDKGPSATDLFVGSLPNGSGGLVGLVDQVRVHSNVYFFWEPENAPWLDRIHRQAMPALKDIMRAVRQPWLLFALDGNPHAEASDEKVASDPAITERFKVELAGAYVPGIKGMAADGKLRIGGFPLTDWTQGGIEFWMRPRGWNSLSDSSIAVFNSKDLSFALPATGQVYKFMGFRASDVSAGDGTETIFQPGRWYHILFSWDTSRITLYIDGRLAAVGPNHLSGNASAPSLDSITFNPYGTAAMVDEVAFFGDSLTAEEAANRYWSYVDPSKVRTAEPVAPLALDAWSFPSERLIRYRLMPLAKIDESTNLFIEATNDAGSVLFRRPTTLSLTPDTDLQVPTDHLPDGRYRLAAVAKTGNKELRSEPWTFELQSFPWASNRLGITDEVFAPFEPIRVADDTASVVQRMYVMNGFGLWDSVVAQGRDLLAAPIRLAYETASGEEGVWTFSQGKFVAVSPHRAEYRASASSAATTVTAVSEIEPDGMMKVTLTLAPSAQRTPIRRMWLEIPVKAAEATLMHEDTGSMRHNYSGRIPQGEGVVWRASRKAPWRNAFAGYVWIGGVERGIAWFAENDKGWITEKALSDRPLQEIVRQGESAVIRVHLVNLPTVIDNERKIVFGLQASPTKPMPADWRTGARGGGLSVVPWGGLESADKFPYQDRWEVVDKIIESQLTGKDNRDWLKNYAKTHDIPSTFGTGDWVNSTMSFAIGRARPTMTYFEEMAAPTYRDEWQVYKDEWSRDRLQPRRPWPTGSDIFRHRRPVSSAYRVNFSSSYRDYGAYYANEWLKRGVGLYWDNTFLTTASDPLTSEAYLAEDGHIQPALTIWNQRAYSKRIWNLVQHWQRERKEKLLFLQHMTNASLLPILSWGTTSFDNEFSAQGFAHAFPGYHNEHEPFPPAYLRAESLGRQVGNYPALVHGLFRFEQFAIDPALVPHNELDRPDEQSIYAQTREWGMRRVHEIPGGGFPAAKLEAALQGFGYDTPRVAVHNYWAERPAVKVDRDDVKWLLVARPADERLFLLLQSWSRNPSKIKVAFDFEVIGFRPANAIVNLESGAAITAAPDGSCELTLDAAYDLRLLGIGAPPVSADMPFADDFANGPSPRWSYISPSLKVVATDTGQSLRIGANATPWQGPTRLEMWEGVDAWRNAAVTIEFRLSEMPARQTGLVEIVTRGEPPQWDRQGLSHTALRTGQFMQVAAESGGGRLSLSRWIIDAAGKRAPSAAVLLGMADTKPHTLTLAMDGAKTKVLLDGVAVATFDDTPMAGAAFAIRGARDLPGGIDVDINRVNVKTGH